MGVDGNYDFSFAFQYLHQRIEWRGVFTQTLFLVKGKKRDAAGGLLDNLPADDRAILIIDIGSGLGHKRAGESSRDGCHIQRHHACWP